MTTNEATEILAEITRRLTEYEQVVAENARLGDELEKANRYNAEDVGGLKSRYETAKRIAVKLGREKRALTAELTEARKQPVAFLPTVTGEMIRALPYVNYCQPHEEHEQMADCLNRNIRDACREAAIERTKPALDVDAFVDEVAETFDTTGTAWPNGFWTGLDRILREHVEHAEAQLPDELMMNALARVERETQQRTRRECAEMVRREVDLATLIGCNVRGGDVLRDLADCMERVK